MAKHLTSKSPAARLAAMGASVFLAFGGIAVISAPSMAAGCQASDYDLVPGQATGTYLLQFKNTSAECTWTVPNGVTSLGVAMVGGGGAAGRFNFGGGGGGGQVLFRDALPVSPNESFTVGVGLGGEKNATDNRPGRNGSASRFGNFSATGGGGGGGSSHWVDANMQSTGSNGGSGGGNSPWTAGSRTRSEVVGNTYDGWTSFGNPGGMGATNLPAGQAIPSESAEYRAGGGGGGAMSAGGDARLDTSSGQTLIQGVGGKSVYLFGKCLGGGGDSLMATTRYPSITLPFYS